MDNTKLVARSLVQILQMSTQQLRQEIGPSTGGHNYPKQDIITSVLMHLNGFTDAATEDENSDVLSAISQSVEKVMTQYRVGPQVPMR